MEGSTHFSEDATPNIILKSANDIDVTPVTAAGATSDDSVTGGAAAAAAAASDSDAGGTTDGATTSPTKQDNNLDIQRGLFFTTLSTMTSCYPLNFILI